MALSPFIQVLGQTLLKEKRLFFYLFYAFMNLHKILYTTCFDCAVSYFNKYGETKRHGDITHFILPNTKSKFSE
jgi:hypothetical protein